MAIAVAVAVAIRLVAGHAFPDYDASFGLVWGHGIAHGQMPDYSLPFRPAGHPLLTALATVVAPLGRSAAVDVVRWAALLGAGFFVAAVFRLGQTAFGVAAGVVAAVLVATRTPTWSYSVLAYMDPLGAALVLYAAVLELRRPRRGGVVFVLLGLAGLIRPEVWAFAEAYWVWIALESRQRALRLLPLALLGPLAWIAWDLALSHTFLGSVATAAGVPIATSAGGHGAAKAPSALFHNLGGFTRPPEAIVAAIGLGLALWWRDRRVLMPVALLAINLVTFVIVAVRSGPLEQRYLLVAGAALLLLAAYAIVELLARPMPALAAGVVLALACVAYSPVDVDRLVHLHGQVRVANAVDEQLRAVVTAPGARCTLRGHVQVPDVRLRPFIAYWGDVPLDRIDTEPGGTGTLAATAPISQELASRSLPSRTAPVPAHVWRLTGMCRGQ